MRKMTVGTRNVIYSIRSLENWLSQGCYFGWNVLHENKKVKGGGENNVCRATEATGKYLNFIPRAMGNNEKFLK